MLTPITTGPSYCDVMRMRLALLVYAGLRSGYTDVLHVLIRRMIAPAAAAVVVTLGFH